MERELLETEYGFLDGRTGFDGGEIGEDVVGGEGREGAEAKAEAWERKVKELVREKYEERVEGEGVLEIDVQGAVFGGS